MIQFNFDLEALIGFFMTTLHKLMQFAKQYWDRKTKDLHIIVKGLKNERPWEIDLSRSTPINFVEWHRKLKSGGQLNIEFDYIKDTNRDIKENKLDEEDIKQLHSSIERVKENGERIKQIIKKSVLDKKISQKIKNIQLFVESVVSKHVPSSGAYSQMKGETIDYVILEAWNEKNESFKFSISTSEYNSVSVKTEKSLKCPRSIFLSEFIELVKDKSILEKEIIPIYLMKHLRQERSSTNEIPLDDIYWWWVSIA